MWTCESTCIHTCNIFCATGHMYHCFSRSCVSEHTLFFIHSGILVHLYIFLKILWIWIYLLHFCSFHATTLVYHLVQYFCASAQLPCSFPATAHIPYLLWHFCASIHFSWDLVHLTVPSTLLPLLCNGTHLPSPSAFMFICVTTHSNPTWPFHKSSLIIVGHHACDLVSKGSMLIKPNTGNNCFPRHKVLNQNWVPLGLF